MKRIVSVSLKPDLVAYADDLAVRATAERRKADPQAWVSRSTVIGWGLRCLRYLRHDHAEPLHGLELVAELLEQGAVTGRDAAGDIRRIVKGMQETRCELGAAAMKATSFPDAARRAES